ncbi:hypothetical protein LTR62_008087 [Meristemomyces frigidus]|uniref:CCHC-type domain-containing protein n=1 Tax=Meristemomyces frigidus TaxID=1508187 RepID=A0AAN7TBI5_9PEZI|nr:hypothetical protein LTR62_008087 [Meristemomyces frigidus]
MARKARQKKKASSGALQPSADSKKPFKREGPKQQQPTRKPTKPEGLRRNKPRKAHSTANKKGPTAAQNPVPVPKMAGRNQINGQSPVESRTMAVGRKRKAIDADPQFSSHEGHKRVRGDPEVISISDNSSQRSSMDEGEIAGGTGSSREGTTTKHGEKSQDSRRKSDEKCKDYFDISLTEVEEDTLRTTVSAHLTANPSLSTWQAMEHLAQKGMPNARVPRRQMSTWRHQPPERSWVRSLPLSAIVGVKSKFAPLAYSATLPATGATSSDQDEAMSMSDDGTTMSDNDEDGGSDGGVSVGQTPADGNYDYGSLARGAATQSHHNSHGAVYMSQISEDEQKSQYRYFHVTDPTALVRCLSCGKEGHMHTTCPDHICTHCIGDHFSKSCPTNRKCRRCRQRGHDQETCTARPTYAGGPNDPCDHCGKDHAEEECSYLWRSYHHDPVTAIRIAEGDLIVSCYNCAASTHWGDDCPDLPHYVLRKLGGKGTWSGQNASKYLKDHLAEDVLARPTGGWQAANAQGGSNGAWQLAQFND